MLVQIFESLSATRPQLHIPQNSDNLFQEYLKDMGITVTGDIILILKHAKAVGGRLATDKALEVAPRKENPSTSSATSNLQLKKTVNIISAPTKSTGNPVVITKPTLSKTTSLVTVAFRY
jgi:hypothetical protein